MKFSCDEIGDLAQALATAIVQRNKAVKIYIEGRNAACAGEAARDVVRFERLLSKLYKAPFPTA